MAKLPKSMADAVTAEPSDGKVARPAKSNIPAGPEKLRVLVQLYLRGRSATTQDYGRFINFINKRVGSRGVKWEFDPKEPPRLDNPDKEFPLVQACLQFRPNEGAGDNNDIHDLQSMVEKGSTLEYPGEDSTSVLLLCQRISSSGSYTLVTGEYFGGFELTQGLAWTEHGSGFAFADRSPTVDALKDLAYNIGGVVLLVDGAYKAANSIRKSIKNGPSPSPQTFSKPPYPQLTSRAHGDMDRGAILDLLFNLLNPSWKHDQMRKLSRSRQELPGTLAKLNESFLRSYNWAKTMTSEDSGDVSIAGTLHLAQLFSEMSSSMKATINEKNELISLHSEEYTKEKRNLHGIFAVAGGCVALFGIALLSPLGPAIWAAGSTFLNGAGIATTGALTTGLCGYRAKTNHEQYTLRCTLKGEMEVAYASLERSKRRLLEVIVFLLFGDNKEAGRFRFKLCTDLDVNVKDVLKVGEAQKDWNEHPGYRMSILKEAWKDFEKHFGEFHRSAARISELG